MIDCPLVSLIVVTYNSAGLLPGFFAALATTRYKLYEVIVVDNASHDTTLDYLAQNQPQVRVLANQANVGFGGACNQGATVARGDLLLFLNPDVTVTPDWLTILVQHIQAQPDVAIICPTTLYPDQRPVSVTTAVAEVAAVPGCAMLVTATAWHILGGFDAQIFLYWEDVELCWRAWLLGGRVLHDQQAVVYHQRGGSSTGQRWDAEQIKNGLYTYLKLMRWRVVWRFVVLLAVKTLVKSVRYRELALLAAWGWNIRHLGYTLAQRRELMRKRRGNVVQLERRIAVQNRQLRSERQQRRSRYLVTRP